MTRVRGRCSRSSRRRRLRAVAVRRRARLRRGARCFCARGSRLTQRWCPGGRRLRLTPDRRTTGTRRLRRRRGPNPSERHRRCRPTEISRPRLRQHCLRIFASELEMGALYRFLFVRLVFHVDLRRGRMLQSTRASPRLLVFFRISPRALFGLWLLHNKRICATRCQTERFKLLVVPSNIFEALDLVGAQRGA